MKTKEKISMADQEKHVQTAIRIPESLLERLDKLAEKMSRPGVRLLRADAMRDAIFRGVDVMEAEVKKR